MTQCYFEEDDEAQNYSNTSTGNQTNDKQSGSFDHATNQQ